MVCRTKPIQVVSTHSRLKAAGVSGVGLFYEVSGFNTQPPEGGWIPDEPYKGKTIRFNTQPPEGGWGFAKCTKARNAVSTHSRLKAAGKRSVEQNRRLWFQHTAA